MMTFKKIDAAVQATVILFFMLSAIFYPIIGVDFLMGYFIVGLIQLISMITHQVKGWFQSRIRVFYHYLAYIIIVICALAFVISVLFYMYWILLYIAPLMAVFYCAICYKEIFFAVKRPLDLI